MSNRYKNIIEGKIEYDSKRYGFYYIDNILTLIPDNDLEEVWKSLFKNLEQTEELLLNGITSNGHKIAFINVKLIKQPGGLYKGFVPAYIMGNANVMNPLPEINNFNSMTFYGKCIDMFFEPFQTLDITAMYDENGSIKLHRISHEVKIVGDKFNLGIDRNITHSNKNFNTPLTIKSYLNIEFEKEKNITDIIEYYRKVDELFKFLYDRKYIDFSKIELTSRGKAKNEEKVIDIINTFDMYIYLPDREKIDLPEFIDSIKYKQIEEDMEKIYLTINEKGFYKNYYNLNKEDDLKITTNKYSNISSAFESWFDGNFPNFKSTTDENYKRLKCKIVEFIDNYIDEEKDKNDKKATESKEILHLFKSEIENLEGSLKEQVEYSLEFFKDCIVNYKNNIVKDYQIEYASEGELNEKIAKTFKTTRNKIVHGNMKDTIMFSNMDVVSYLIVEKLVRCLVFNKSGVDMIKIKEIVDDRFRR